MYFEGGQERVEVYVNVSEYTRPQLPCYLKHISYLNMLILTKNRPGQETGQVSAFWN